jgi:hypothetical protein
VTGWGKLEKFSNLTGGRSWGKSEIISDLADARLYRLSHDTFEDYCRERWGMARNYANKMVAAAEVVANLGTNVPKLPVTESQARPRTRGRAGVAVNLSPIGDIAPAHAWAA